MLSALIAALPLALPLQHASDEPTLPVSPLPADLVLDGRLEESAWQEAAAVDFTMVEPVEGGEPTCRTVMRVLAGKDALVLGFECFDPDPAGIVAQSVERDSFFIDEDFVAVVLGPSRDGRTGYIFVVNPLGARYDALVAERGESDIPEWDGVWEAAAVQDESGWSTEIRIPVRTLTFPAGANTWHLNAERSVRRLLEVSRWSGARRDWRVAQTSHAGLVTDLPEFDLGLGLTFRPSLVGYFGREGAGFGEEGNLDAALDMEWRITPDLRASLTVNTDFAETEVDARQTNLSRFDLFYPEKRSFFLEGADAFDFGLGLGQDVVPFYSRRIGLVDGREVPILAGAKLHGRIGSTTIGLLGVETGSEPGLASETALGVVRLKQDVLDESSLGILATAGDPLSRSGSWLAGADFTYQTSRLWGGRNFLAGVWGLTMNREGLAGDRSAWGVKLDYPNDLWDLALVYKRIGDGFDPSLGFVPRTNVERTRLKVEYMPRPELSWLRQTFHEFEGILWTGLDDHRWESYEINLMPFELLFENGNEFEVGLSTRGDRPDSSFEVADGVEVQAGSYEWTAYGAEFRVESTRSTVGLETAAWWGPWYDGDRQMTAASLFWRPAPILTLEAEVEHNDGELPAGAFNEAAYGLRGSLNFSSDLFFTLWAQYDTESDSIGVNNRLGWTLTPESALYFVYNNNWNRFGDRWLPDGRDTTVKFEYELRF